jgi:hypothetical protein
MDVSLKTEVGTESTDTLSRAGLINPPGTGVLVSILGRYKRPLFQGKLRSSSPVHTFVH